MHVYACQSYLVYVIYSRPIRDRQTVWTWHHKGRLLVQKCGCRADAGNPRSSQYLPACGAHRCTFMHVSNDPLRGVYVIYSRPIRDRQTVWTWHHKGRLLVQKCGSEIQFCLRGPSWACPIGRADAGNPRSSQYLPACGAHRWAPQAGRYWEDLGFPASARPMGHAQEGPLRQNLEITLR
jgi:hypothetical protein